MTLQGREPISFGGLDVKMALSILMAFPSGNVLGLTQSQLRTVPIMGHGIGGLIEERNDEATLLAKSRAECDALSERLSDAEEFLERLPNALDDLAQHIEYARVAKPQRGVHMEEGLAQYNNIGMLTHALEGTLVELLATGPTARATTRGLHDAFIESRERLRACAQSLRTVIVPPSRSRIAKRANA
jgi:hypothetical protein